MFLVGVEVTADRFGLFASRSFEAAASIELRYAAGPNARLADAGAHRAYRSLVVHAPFMMFFVTILVGCGGRFVSEKTDSGPLPDASVDGALDTALTKARCPADAPIEGRACSLGAGQPYLECSYGDAASVECRKVFHCVDWTHESPPTPRWRDDSGRCVDSICPAVRPREEPTDCTPGFGPCPYPDDALCWCIEPAKWSCVEPPPGCPRRVPNAGTSCAGTARCPYVVYGPPCRGVSDPSRFGTLAVCVEGVWEWEDGGCGR